MGYQNPPSKTPHVLSLRAHAERCVEAGAPTKGLTFRKGNHEVNVLAVNCGMVFYGEYRDGREGPVRLSQAPMSEWNRLAIEAIQAGAEVFTTLHKRGRIQG